MPRTQQALNAALAVCAILMACGAQAADGAAQRLALACTAASCNSAPMHHQPAPAQRPMTTVAKAPVQQPKAATASAADLDNARFTFDSCGCSI